MLILDATTKTLTAQLEAAATTTNPGFVTSYADITTTVFTPGEQDGALNGASIVTICNAPAASTQRQIKEVYICNTDTVPHVITISYNDNGTYRQLLSWTIAVGDVLSYNELSGWLLTTSSGSPKGSGTVYFPTRTLFGSFDLENVTNTMTTVSNTSYVMYMGASPVTSSSINFVLRVTTASGTITWAEVGVFKGSINLNGNPTLTRLGSLDVSAVVNSTGIKNIQVTLSTPCQIGDEIWFAYGNQATTALIVRAGVADDIQSGVYASLAATRISTVASPTAWTLNANTLKLPFCRGYIN